MERMTASKAPTTSSISDVETGKGLPVSIVSAKIFQQHAEQIDRRIDLRLGLRAHLSETVSDVSSRASAEPLVPNTMIRQYIGAARTVASRPVAPLSNCTSAAAASRGSGGGFCEKTRRVHFGDRPGQD